MENLKNYLIKRIEILNEYVDDKSILDDIEQEVKKIRSSGLNLYNIFNRLTVIEDVIKSKLSPTQRKNLTIKLTSLDKENKYILDFYRILLNDLRHGKCIDDQIENDTLRDRIYRLESRISILSNNMNRLIETPKLFQREAENKLNEIDEKFSQLINLKGKDFKISDKIADVYNLEEKLKKLETDAQNMLNSVSTVQLAKHYLEAKNEYGVYYHKYPECNWWNIVGFFKYVITNIIQVGILFYIMFLTSLFSFAFIYWKFVSGNTLNYKYLPLALPFIWCAWHFQRKINTREKLYELYNHKQRVMETYVAFKNGTYTLAADDKMEQVLLDAVKKDPSGYIGKNNDTIIESVLDRINGKIILSKVKNRLEEENSDD